MMYVAPWSEEDLYWNEIVLIDIYFIEKKKQTPNIMKIIFNIIDSFNMYAKNNVKNGQARTLIDKYSLISRHGGRTDMLRIYWVQIKIDGLPEKIASKMYPYNLYHRQVELFKMTLQQCIYKIKCHQAWEFVVSNDVF